MAAKTGCMEKIKDVCVELRMAIIANCSVISGTVSFLSLYSGVFISARGTNMSEEKKRGGGRAGRQTKGFEKSSKILREN